MLRLVDIISVIVKLVHVGAMMAAKHLIDCLYGHHMAGLPAGQATLAFSGHRVKETFSLAKALHKADNIELVLDLLSRHQHNLQ